MTQAEFERINKLAIDWRNEADAYDEKHRGNAMVRSPEGEAQINCAIRLERVLADILNEQAL